MFFLVINIKKHKKKFLSAIVILLTLIVFFLCAYCFTKILFPVKYFNTIKKYCLKYNLEPELVCSIIYTESKFKINAISKKNARGLMQIKKTTADWAASKINLKDYNYNKIFEPEININIGCWYINNLLKQFNNNYKLVLCAYNAGSGNVSKWLLDKKYSRDQKNLFYIPFKETRNYVKRVMLHKKIYRIIIHNRFLY